MNWVAGIDEIGSETQISEGWTYTLLPQVAIDAINSAVSYSNINFFHGKKFKEAEKEEYKIFLTAIRDELHKHDNAFLVFTLQEKSWKDEFLSFTDKLISEGLQGAGVSDSNTVKIIRHLFPSLITFQRIANNINLPDVDIEIDSDDISKNLNEISISIQNKNIKTSKLLELAYNSYMKKIFPNSLKLNGIQALSDTKSRAIQVADVFGNFAMSYIFKQLGCQSKKRIMKAEIFESVFKDEISSDNILNKVKLSAEPIMILKSCNQVH